MSRSRGFTLVELLLAVTLMSMLLALAYGGFRTATRATDRGQTILEDSSRIRMAHQFVRKQLNQAVPLAFDEGADAGERMVFEGTSRLIRYVGPMPGYLGFGGLQVQELAIVPGDGDLRLVLSHAPLQEFEEAALYARAPILLVDKIEDARFAFQGLDEEGELTEWMNRWTEPALLPKAVSLELDFQKEVYIDWPMLTASVRIDSAAIGQLAGAPTAKREYSAAIRRLIQRRGEEE